MPELPEYELAEWAREWNEAARRQLDERLEFDRRRDDLLIRAREAGMTNTEIAIALNAGCHNLLDYLAFEPYTPQSVTALMREAEKHIEWAVWQFTRDSLEEES